MDDLRHIDYHGPRGDHWGRRQLLGRYGNLDPAARVAPGPHRSEPGGAGKRGACGEPGSYLGVRMGRRTTTLTIAGLLALGSSTGGLAPATAQPACVAVPGGLVTWWPGDGNAKDVWGENDGTLRNGATFAAGKVGSAFSLDGVDDYVSSPGTSINGLQQLSIDAWVKPAELPSGEFQRFVSLSAPDTEKAVLRHDGVNGPQQLHFFMGIDGVPRHIRVDGALQAGVFQHVAGTYDGSVMRLYLNGAEVGSLPVTGVVDTSTRANVSGLESFNGLVDEVEIFDRALSAEEVKAIYDAGSAGKCKPRPCFGRKPTHIGTNGDDELRGTKGGDVLLALAGNDRVLGRAGDDSICAGPGNDTIAGGPGHDAIDGGAGHDATLVGGGGRDDIRGKGGRDTLKGGKGRDTLKGGKGRDKLIGGPGVDTCIGGPGADTFRGCEKIKR